MSDNPTELLQEALALKEKLDAISRKFHQLEDANLVDEADALLDENYEAMDSRFRALIDRHDELVYGRRLMAPKRDIGTEY